MRILGAILDDWDVQLNRVFEYVIDEWCCRGRRRKDVDMSKR